MKARMGSPDFKTERKKSAMQGPNPLPGCLLLLAGSAFLSWAAFLYLFSNNCSWSMYGMIAIFLYFWGAQQLLRSGKSKEYRSPDKHNY